MDNMESNNTLDYEETLIKGFSKKQIQKFTKEDIEDLDIIENSSDSPIEKKDNEDSIGKRPAADGQDPNDGGARPPKEEEYPEKPGDDDDDLLSESSDPNKKD